MKPLADRKGECPWHTSPAGVQSALLSWCPAVAGFDVVISGEASWHGVLVRSPLATSCFGEPIRNAFFCLAVINIVCLHQVLNRRRPAGATFSQSDVMHMCLLDVLFSVVTIFRCCCPLGVCVFLSPFVVEGRTVC